MRWPIFILFLSTSSFALADSANRCADPNRKTSIECQIQAYQGIVKKCKNHLSECGSEISTAFKDLESSFPLCLNHKESEELSLDIPYATKEECTKLEKFVVSQVVPSNPSYLEIGRALKFINQRVHLKTSQKQAGLQ